MTFPVVGLTDSLQRIALGMGVSTGIIPQLAFLLDRSAGRGLTPEPMLVSISAVIVVTSVAALTIRHRTTEEERFFLSQRCGMALRELCPRHVNCSLWYSLCV